MRFSVQGFGLELVKLGSDRWLVLSLVKDLNLSYQNKETVLFTIDPYCYIFD